MLWFNSDSSAVGDAVPKFALKELRFCLHPQTPWRHGANSAHLRTKMRLLQFGQRQNLTVAVKGGWEWERCSIRQVVGVFVEPKSTMEPNQDRSIGWRPPDMLKIGG
jgi:hypothetical protein